jgi:hypothetical protein
MVCVGGSIEILGFRVLRGRARNLRAFYPPPARGGGFHDQLR